MPPPFLTRTVAAGAGRRVRPHVREQVVQDLPQPLAVALHLDRLRRVELDLAAGVERAGRLDRVTCDLLDLDGLALERASLVEPGEQEQVVDEQSHPARLALDAGHRALEIVGPLARAAVEELRIGAHRGERRAQLVRGIGDEAPQPVLGRRPFVEGLLDLTEHGVEGATETPDLGARVVVFDALREIAARNRGGGGLDPAERPQPDTDEPEPEQEDSGEHGEGNSPLDDEQPVQGVVGLVQRRGDDEKLVRASDRLDLDAVARVAFDCVDREGATGGGRRGCATRGQIGLRQRRLAWTRSGRAPAHGSVGRGADVEAGVRRTGRVDRVEDAGAGPAVLERLHDRVGAALRLVVDAVDQEGAELLVGDDARDDEADRGERDDDGEEARPERHCRYDSRSA